MRDPILALHIATGSFGLILGPVAGRIWWFLPIAAFSYANAFVGWRAARRRRPGWLPTHIAGMGGSYIALTTAVLVVNLGAAAWYAWVLPTLAGTPLIRMATRARSGRSSTVAASW